MDAWEKDREEGREKIKAFVEAHAEKEIEYRADVQRKLDAITTKEMKALDAK